MHSAAGVLRPGSGAIRRPPFRAPHHGASAPALVGGGAGPAAGRDLAGERRRALPRRADGVLAHARSRRCASRSRTASWSSRARPGRVRFPARVQLVAAANPCPCGGLGGCTCTNERVERYRARLERSAGRPPRPRRARRRPRSRGAQPRPARRRRASSPRASAAARDWQAARGQKRSPNARLELAELERLGIAPDARELLERAADSQRLSARRQVRVLRLARSAADLARSGGVAREHVAEALALIPRGRGLG